MGNIIKGGDLLDYKPNKQKADPGRSAAEAIDTNVEDRNRTAPFPFCGNRFEFRAVGASQNIALPLTFVNTAVAAGFSALSDKIEGGQSVRDAVAETLEENFRVIFNGDDYSAEWVAEAESRGLPNLNNATKALSTFDSDKNKELFSSTKVFGAHEVTARKDILLGEVANAILIEARTALRMVETGYKPAFAADLKTYADANLQSGDRRAVYEAVDNSAAELSSAIDAFPADGSAQEQAEYSSDTLRPALNELRGYVDRGEGLCEASLVPYAGYQQILF